MRLVICHLPQLVLFGFFTGYGLYYSFTVKITSKENYFQDFCLTGHLRNHYTGFAVLWHYSTYYSVSFHLTGRLRRRERKGRS